MRLTSNPRFRSIATALSFGVIGKGAGFLVPVAIAAAFGVSRDSDSFFLAFAVASVLLPIWTQSVEQFTVPLFVDVRGIKNVQTRVRWAMRRASLGAAVTALAGLVGLYIYLSIWSDSDFRRATLISYLLLIPQVLISARGAIYSGYIISRGDYRWSPGTIALRALGVLVMVAVSPRRFGLASVAAGYSIGEVARVFALRWAAHHKLNYEPHTQTEQGIPAAGTVRRAGHQLSSMAMMGVGPLIERSVAATLGVGIVSRLEYASKLFYVPSVLFDTNFVSVFLSDWSRLAAQQQWDRFTKDVRTTLRLIFSAAVVVAVIVTGARSILVRVALTRGAFPATEAMAVAHVLAILMLALPFSATSMLAAAAYVSIGQNRLILRVCVAKMVIRATGSLVLGPVFGLDGIAWIFVLTHVVELILYSLPFTQVIKHHARSIDSPLVSYSPS